MTRAHSCPWKILPNSTGKFAKFCGLARQNHPNFAAFHLWVKWALSCSKTLVSEGPTGIVTLCWVMLAMYKENYLSFFRVKSAMCHVALHLFTIVSYCDSYISMAHSFWQFSLIFSVIKSHQIKNRTNCRWIFNIYKIPRNSAKISKFWCKGKILQLCSKFHGPRKTVGSSCD